MHNEPKGGFVQRSEHRVTQRIRTKKHQQACRSGRFRAVRTVSAGLAVYLLYGGVTAAQGDSPTQLRRFIDQQVGGVQNLIVPAHNADLPQPRLADGSPDPRFQTTEAKRYLGKLLFHEPARATRIIPEFGGIPAHSGTASCGSCHLGEAASKSGTLLNFATGGEGRGYTDADGNFVARRRPLPDLPILRQTPLFPGDALVDALPTLTDIYLLADGTIEVNTPALLMSLCSLRFPIPRSRMTADGRNRFMREREYLFT